MTREEHIIYAKNLRFALNMANNLSAETMEAFDAAIKALEQESKTGHWVRLETRRFFRSHDFKCSECGNTLDFDGVNCGRGDANYCPNCGAKMQIESEE